jgi:hypothetical protein
MKMTGHKTEPVYRRYAIVSDADLREAADKFARSSQSDRTDRMGTKSAVLGTVAGGRVL